MLLPTTAESLAGCVALAISANLLLAPKNLIISKIPEVFYTRISAQRSIRSAGDESDPEICKGKKVQQSWHRTIAHIAVNADSGLCHKLNGTVEHAIGIVECFRLPLGHESSVFAGDGTGIGSRRPSAEQRVRAMQRVRRHYAQLLSIDRFS